MRRIFYLTRSYLPDKSGGILMRAATVKFFKENGLQVIVVTPGYNGRSDRQNDIWYIPYITKLPVSLSIKLHSFCEKIGIYEDYLDPWVKCAYNYLKGHISSEDIIFATSGGELGNIKLGSLLKSTFNCKFVINFRDPLDYSLVNNMKLDSKFHVSREGQEQHYLSKADMIITSSQSHLKSLQIKYPALSSKMANNYFGYIEKTDLAQKPTNSELKLAYSGSFSEVQAPEILAKAIAGVKDDELKLHVYFIGQYRNYLPLLNYSSTNSFIPFMPHTEYVEFMIKNVDVGLMSLAADYFGACVPSKLYEYINLGIPIIGALPEGDAMDIINTNKYGIACKYNDVIGLQNAIQQMADRNMYNKFRNNVLKDRDKWFMGNRIKEVIDWLRVL